ncbi:MAG: hypothetical protein AABZ55_03975 [Bdellovibrionota bacterium]
MAQKLSETSVQKLELMAWRIDNKGLWKLFKDIQTECNRQEHGSMSQEGRLDLVRKLGVVGKELARRGYWTQEDGADIHRESEKLFEKRSF